MTHYLVEPDGTVRVLHPPEAPPPPPPLLELPPLAPHRGQTVMCSEGNWNVLPPRAVNDTRTDAEYRADQLLFFGRCDP